MLFRSAVTLVMMMVRVVVLGVGLPGRVGGPWALLTLAVAIPGWGPGG